MIQRDDRTCARILRLLDAYASSELLAETNLDIVDHLEACPACAALLESKLQLKQAVKRAIQDTPVPEDLVENVRRSLPRPAARQNRRVWAAAAMILLALLLGGLLWQTRPAGDTAAAVDTQPILRMAADVHNRCPMDGGIQALGNEYEGLVDTIGEDMPSNYGIAAAHRCILGDRLFVHLVLEEGESRISFAVTEKSGERLASGQTERALDAAGVPVYAGTVGNTQVAAFETPRHLVFVASNLTRDINLHLASSIAALYAPSVRTMLKEVRSVH